MAGNNWENERERKLEHHIKYILFQPTTSYIWSYTDNSFHSHAVSMNSSAVIVKGNQVDIKHTRRE